MQSQWEDANRREFLSGGANRANDANFATRNGEIRLAKIAPRQGREFRNFAHSLELEKLNFGEKFASCSLSALRFSRRHQRPDAIVGLYRGTQPLLADRKLLGVGYSIHSSALEVWRSQLLSAANFWRNKRPHRILLYPDPFTVPYPPGGVSFLNFLGLKSVTFAAVSRSLPAINN